jgi:hypothetical protein
MVEVVGRLPVVEYLVAVLDWGKVGGDDVGDGEDSECRARLELWRLLYAGSRLPMRMLVRWLLHSGTGHWWFIHCIET